MHLLRPLVILTFASAIPAPGTAPAAEPLPPGQATLRFAVPDRATLKFDGFDLGTERSVTASKVAPDRFYQRWAEVRLPNGQTISRRFNYRDGWQIDATVRPPGEEPPDLVAQSRHADAVYDVGFTSDGKYLLTGSADRTAVLWEADTGTQVRTYAGVPNQVMGVAVGPNDDLVAAAVGRHETFLDDVGGAAVYDRVTGEQKLWIDLGPCLDVAFLPDGKQIVVAAEDGKIYQVDIAARRTVRAFGSHRSWAIAVAAAADGKTILSGSYDGTAVVWDVATGNRVRTLDHRGNGVIAVAYAPGGRLLTGSSGGSAVLWDAATGNPVRTFTNKPGNPVLAVAADPAGTIVVTGNGDNTGTVWDAATGKARHTLVGHTDVGFIKGVPGVALRPGTGEVVTCSTDLTARLWDPATGKPVRKFSQDLDRPFGLKFSPDGKQLIATVGKKSVVRWDPTTPTTVQSAQEHKDLVFALDTGADKFITGSKDKTAIVWETATLTPLVKLPANDDPAKGHNEMVNDARLSPDGTTALTTTRAPRKDGKLLGAGAAYLWDVTAGPTGKLKFRLNENRGSVWTAAFSPDGKLVATGDGDELENNQFLAGKVVLWDAATGRKVRTLDGHTKQIGLIEFSPDGAKLLSGSKDRTLVLWDVATGRKIRTFDAFPQQPTGFNFLPDGKHIVVGCADGFVRLYNADTGAMLQLFKGHAGAVEALAVHPDGRHFVTDGGDGVIFYWDIAVAEPVAWFVTLNDGTDWLAVTPDGLYDGTAAGRKNVGFRVDGKLEVVSADRFFKDYWRPGLLKPIWGGSPPKPDALPGTKPAPKVKILTPPPAGPVEADEFEVEIEVQDTGSGVGKVRLAVDGQGYFPRPTAEAKVGDRVRQKYKFELAHGERTITFRVEAKSPGAPASEPASLTVVRQNPDEVRTLRVVAIGVSEYQNGRNLTFAAKDAETVAELLQTRGRGVHNKVAKPIILTDSRATLAQIRKAFSELASEVRPADTLVVFISGHGVRVAGEGDGPGEYYFLPHDASFPTVEGQAPANGLSGSELTQLILPINVRRMIILDTCHSGQGLNQFLQSLIANNINAEYEMSPFILAAAPPEDVAKESEKLGGSVLTYCLRGLVNEPVRAIPGVRLTPLANASGARIDVHDWCDVTAKAVQKVMRDVYRVDQGRVIPVFGSYTFDILQIE